MTEPRRPSWKVVLAILAALVLLALALRWAGIEVGPWPPRPDTTGGPLP